MSTRITPDTDPFYIVPANKNLFKVSVTNIGVLDFLWICFGPLTCCVFTPCEKPIKPMIERSLIVEVKEKSYGTSISMT